MPTNFSLKPTGEGTEVTFHFGAAAGNGAKPSEITYRWNAGGESGTVTDGKPITSSAFRLGQDVQVQLRAISTVDVNGETAEGPVVSATVNAYQPPAPPSVSARGNVNDVTQTWDMPKQSGGRPITSVQLHPGGNVGLSGSRTLGNGRNQTHCIRARAQNSEGDWSNWSGDACGQTWANPKATDWKGAQTSCGGTGFAAPCTRVMLTLERWNPNSTVICPFKGTRGEWIDLSTRVNADGWWEGQVRDWVFGGGYPADGDITHECRQG